MVKSLDSSKLSASSSKVRHIMPKQQDVVAKSSRNEIFNSGMTSLPSPAGVSTFASTARTRSIKNSPKAPAISKTRHSRRHRIIQKPKSACNDLKMPLLPTTHLQQSSGMFPEMSQTESVSHSCQRTLRHCRKQTGLASEHPITPSADPKHLPLIQNLNMFSSMSDTPEELVSHPADMKKIQKPKSACNDFKMPLLPTTHLTSQTESVSHSCQTTRRYRRNQTSGHPITPSSDPKRFPLSQHLNVLSSMSDTPEESVGHPADMIGGRPEAWVYVADVKCACLIDTGAQVTTLTDVFHRKHLPWVPIRPLSDIITTEGLGGFQVDYTGYIMADIRFPQHLLANSDTYPTPALISTETSYSHVIPMILGTNVLRRLDTFPQLFQKSNEEAEGKDFAFRDQSQKICDRCKHVFETPKRVCRSLRKSYDHQQILNHQKQQCHHLREDSGKKKKQKHLPCQGQRQCHDLVLDGSVRIYEHVSTSHRSSTRASSNSRSRRSTCATVSRRTRRRSVKRLRHRLKCDLAHSTSRPRVSTTVPRRSRRRRHQVIRLQYTGLGVQQDADQGQGDRS